jgi:hypothetical protein
MIIYKGDDLTIGLNDDYTIYSGVTATIWTDGQNQITAPVADNVIKVESDELKKLNSGVIAYNLSYYTDDPDYADGKYNQSQTIYTDYYLQDNNQFGVKSDQSDVNNYLSSRLNSVEEKAEMLIKTAPIVITVRVDDTTKKIKMDDELAMAKKIIKEQGRPIVMFVGNNNPNMYVIYPTLLLYDNKSDKTISVYIEAESPEATYEVDVYYNYDDSDEENGRYIINYTYTEKSDD